jgi:DUF917 family protein
MFNMPTKTLQNRQEVEDFVRGLTFYGTGGGGDYQIGVDVLMEQLEKGHNVGWTDAGGLRDGQYTCCPFLMGSIAPMTEETRREMKEIYGLKEPLYNYTGIMKNAVTALQELVGQKISALIPIELGGANAASCACAAAELGIAMLDCDYTGRAIPEIQQTTPFVYEKELLPITSCDAWGNTAVINKSYNWRMAERVGKQLSVAGYGLCGQAGFFMNAADTRDALINGTMTECYQVGKLLREACEAGKAPAEAVAAELGGWLVCKGTVTGKKWWDKIGYYWGEHTITGQGEFSGVEVKIWFKNENHVSWKNGETFITSPDMLQVIDAKTGHPYTNNKIEEGFEVAVIALKAREMFRSPRGLLALGPRAFGFDIDYRPVEKILG